MCIISIRTCWYTYSGTSRRLITKKSTFAYLYTYSKTIYCIAKKRWIYWTDRYTLSITCWIIAPVWWSTICHTSFIRNTSEIISITSNRAIIYARLLIWICESIWIYWTKLNTFLRVKLTKFGSHTLITRRNAHIIWTRIGI